MQTTTPGPINPRYTQARRRAARLSHPHLDYPAYVRQGYVQHVHELAGDATLPITGPVKLADSRKITMDDVVLVCSIGVLVSLLFIGG